EVRGARDLSERHPLLRRASNRELAVAQLDVLRRRLQLMSDDRLRLLGDLGGAAGERLAADRQRARPVRVPALRASARVAVHDFDDGRIDAEPVGDDLSESGLVPLTVAGAAR